MNTIPFQETLTGCFVARNRFVRRNKLHCIQQIVLQLQEAFMMKENEFYDDLSVGVDPTLDSLPGLDSHSVNWTKKLGSFIVS